MAGDDTMPKVEGAPVKVRWQRREGQGFMLNLRRHPIINAFALIIFLLLPGFLPGYYFQDMQVAKEGEAIKLVLSPCPRFLSFVSILITLRQASVVRIMDTPCHIYLLNLRRVNSPSLWGVLHAVALDSGCSVVDTPSLCGGVLH
jgi:hypothetical protein